MASQSSSFFASLASNLKTLVPTTLDHTNFITWKAQIQIFFLFNDLTKFVDGTLPKPEIKSNPTTPTSSHTSTSAETPKTKFKASKDVITESSLSLNEWQKMDSFVTACIIATMSYALVSQALGFASSRDLWLSLEESFLHQSRARKLLLRSQIRFFKKNNLSIVEYLQHICFLASALGAIGDPISDSDLVLIALDGLPLSYHLFITSIEKMDSPPSFAMLRAKLLIYEKRVLSDGSPTSQTDEITHTAIVSQLENSTLSSRGNNSAYSTMGRRSSSTSTVKHN